MVIQNQQDQLQENLIQSNIPAPVQPDLVQPSSVQSSPAKTSSDPIDYSKYSGKQNRALAEGINAIVEDNLSEYTKPTKSRDDLIARGFIDKNGVVTEKGILADSLRSQGLLDNTYTVTPNGALFATKESDLFTPGNAEAASTYTSFFNEDPSRIENVRKWKKLKDLGVFEPSNIVSEKERSFSDTLVEKGKGFLDFAANAGKTLQSAVRIVDGFQSPEEKAQDIARTQGFTEGIIENAALSFANQAASVGNVINSIDYKIGAISKEQKYDFDAFNEYKAASYKNFFDKTKTAAALGTAVGYNAIADQIEQSAKVLGPDKSEAIQKEGQQVGAAAGDITNIETGAAMSILGPFVKSGATLLDSVLNSKRIAQVGEAMAATAQASLYEARAAQAAGQSKLWATEVGRANELARGATLAGDTEQAALHLANESNSAKIAAKAAAEAEQHSAMAQTLRETANGLENTLPPTVQSQIIQAAKVPVAFPLKAAGFASDKIANGLVLVDKGVSKLLDIFDLNKYRKWARAASIFTGHINPVTIGESILASHKIWSGAGRLLDSVGENMLVNQGTIPFFSRVAADMSTPVGKVFATQLNNFLPPIARGIGSITKGIAGAAAPSLIYEAINHQGVDSNTLKQAASDAVIFGGGHGLFNAAIIGRPTDYNATRLADRLNFNDKLKASDTKQYEIYNSKVDPSTKNLISSFSGAYPNVNIKFSTDGPSYQVGNTAVFNVNSPKEFAGTIALHELKHVLQNEHQLTDVIEAHMIGNKTRLGEIFKKDGSLDPEFKSFSNEYNSRMRSSGMPELNMNDLAVEFYTDKAAEVLKSDIQSGEFTRRAQESQLSRTVKAHFSTLMNQVPIIKNIHIKTGGAIDSSGRLVKGSGLLSDGFTQSKEVQAMVRKMYRETAGLNRKSNSVDPNLTSVGQPKPTTSTREGINNGKSAVEKVNRELRSSGADVPEGALDPSTERGMEGVPTSLQIKAIIDSGAIHPDHLGTFPMLVGEMTPDSNATFLFHYKPAKQGRTIQNAAGESFHHFKPSGVKINKRGDVSISGLDINLWDSNIKEIANSSIAKKLNYTEKQIREDSYEASKYHIQNKSPDAYFESKYGKAQVKVRKSIIASTYGAMTESQHGYNPLLSKLNMNRPNSVYRTFSLDDIKSVTRTNSTVDLSFDPNNYYSLKVNLMPEVPRITKNGDLVIDSEIK